MKRCALALRDGLFAVALVFLAGSLRADGADSFALTSLENGRTISDAGRYGTIEPNGLAQPGNHFVPFARRENLPAGRYQFSDEAIRYLPEEAGRPGRTATTYVPPPPNSAPALAIGQKFLRVVMGEVGEMTAPTSEVVTLVAIDAERRPRRFTLVAQNKASSSIESDADVAHLRGLRPIESDENLALARRAFSGRDVWTLGTVALTCLATPGKSIFLSGGTRVRIEGIFRVQNLPSFHAIGQQNNWGRDSDSSFWTVDPLVVVVRVPPGTEIGASSESHTVTAHHLPLTGGMLPPGTSVGSSGIVGLPGKVRPTGRRGAHAPVSLSDGCRIGTNELSDPWELERTFTTASPEAHRSWTTTVRSAIVDHRIVLGMPRDAVAYVEGYPDSYGTVAEMNRLKVWSYDSPAPFSFSVGFDRNGRVDSYQPPGNLP